MIIYHDLCVFKPGKWQLKSVSIRLVPTHMEKGKYASSTENRRLVWEYVIWPLILDVNRNYFTLQEYHIKRDCVCENKEILPSKVAGGFVSLLVKGILVREKNIYSIHYKLIPYMRKKVHLDYGTVIREINTKK